MSTAKRVLVCPMDWGLGHATRSIPVIRELTAQGCEVMIASSGDALILLKEEFPECKFFTLTGYRPYYAPWGMALAMLRQLRKFSSTISREHSEVGRIVADHAIDCIISDNRYGCWSPNVRSVIVTHQLTIRSPFLAAGINYFNHRMLKRFSAIWVPDFAGDESLAGDLSKATGLSVKYIGPLSRFTAEKGHGIKYDFLAILSGPEPQRTILEKKLHAALKHSGKRILMVLGKPGLASGELSGDIKSVNHLSAQAMQAAIAGAAVVLSRSGYSSIMDLAVLGKKAIFLPTPGQTEQEYLAKRFNDKKIAWSIGQDEFTLAAAEAMQERYTGFVNLLPDSLLAAAIRNLLQ